MAAYIENEGALFRGPSVSWPEEVWSPSRARFVPYTGKVPKPIGWGTVISEGAARAWTAAGECAADELRQAEFFDGVRGCDPGRDGKPYRP